jgi:cyclase
MLKKRIIAVLLTDGRGNCIKPTSFGPPYRKAGPLIQHVMVMNGRDVDELVIIDILATKENRVPNYNILEKCAKECFMPLAIGGGIECMGVAENILQKCGADKVLIKTGLNNRKFLENMGHRFGEQSLVAAIDYNSEYDYKDVIKKVKDLPIGEAIVTNTSHEAQQSGYDINLLTHLCHDVDIPIIANGGCGHPSDMVKAFKAGASGAAAGYLFMYTPWTPKKCAKYVQDNSEFPVRL